jgi:alkylhydroperoxidase/carboxymuconolactone decarboxylase family protein
MAQKKIEDLGKLHGKILLFGGVYSNLHALGALRDLAREEGIPPENCIGTGDLLGYCAHPEETVEAMRSWGAKNIAGNVERQLASGEADCGCNFEEGSRCDTLSTQWYPFVQREISQASLQWIAGLPDHIRFQTGGLTALVVHGSLRDISEFRFCSSPENAFLEDFRQAGTDLIIAGHCGLPFTREFGAGKWLNPGVVGMPANDGTPRVWYMVLETGADGRPVYRHRALAYDYRAAAADMLKKGLPEAYADTLLSGIWDTMEILPPKERLQQGIPLALEPAQPTKNHEPLKNTVMASNYYDPADLRKFGKITEWSEDLGKRFFEYYGKVFEEGALSAREKSLIALAVSHVVKCPYCIDAYTKDGLQRGITKEEMMEAVHTGAAIESGATLVHAVQMMNKYNKLSM